MREVDKFEKAILEFGMDAALEYFATPINLHDEFKAEWDKIKNLGERSEPPTSSCAKCADLQKSFAQQLINYLELFAEKEPELWEAIKIENKETIKEIIKKLEKAKRNK